MFLPNKIKTRVSLKCSAWKRFVNFALRRIFLKILGPKKMLCQKFFFKKQIGSEKFWYTKKVLSEKILVRKNFGSKFFLDPIKFLV